MAGPNRVRKGGKGGKRKIGRAARKASNHSNARVHRDAVYHRGLGTWLAVGKGIPAVTDGHMPMAAERVK